MSKKELVVDTMQLERLSQELSLFPNELQGAIKSSLKSGIHFSLKKIVTKYYALNPKKINGTFKVRIARDDKSNYVSMRYEVIGRRLTPTHFSIFPKTIGAVRPVLEIIRGSLKPAEDRRGADGKMKTPFVMGTGAKYMDREYSNVFIKTGDRQEKKRLRSFIANGESVFFRARLEKLKSYRTVSVPQMIGNPKVANAVQDELLYTFDKVLFKRIESRTGIVQQNISKG